MRDKWVAVYLLLVALQLPVYYHLGRRPLSFEFAVKDAERRLSAPFTGPGQKEAAENALRLAEEELDLVGEQSSRRARLALDQGILAWRMGDAVKALERLETSRKIFSATHGPEAFHTAAVDLRIGELLFLQSNFSQAIVRFQRSLQPVQEYLGPRNPFVLRMVYRRVSTLVSLGRMEEAGRLAREHIAGLRGKLAEFDAQFLTDTGGYLDILQRQGLLIPAPKGWASWRAYLRSGQESGGEVRNDPDESAG